MRPLVFNLIIGIVSFSTITWVVTKYGINENWVDLCQSHIIMLMCYKKYVTGAKGKIVYCHLLFRNFDTQDL